MIQRFYIHTPPFASGRPLPSPQGELVKFADVQDLVTEALATTGAMKTRSDESVLMALIDQLEEKLKSAVTDSV